MKMTRHGFLATLAAAVTPKPKIKDKSAVSSRRAPIVQYGGGGGIGVGPSVTYGGNGRNPAHGMGGGGAAWMHNSRLVSHGPITVTFGWNPNQNP